MLKKTFYLAVILSLITTTHSAYLVKLLDEIHEAQAYWEQVAHTSRAYFWKQPISAWMPNSNWKATIQRHQTALAKQEKVLIH